MLVVVTPNVTLGNVLRATFPAKILKNQNAVKGFLIGFAMILC